MICCLYLLANHLLAITNGKKAEVARKWLARK
jgi:hypothetical protein